MRSFTEIVNGSDQKPNIFNYAGAFLSNELLVGSGINVFINGTFLIEEKN